MPNDTTLPATQHVESEAPLTHDEIKFNQTRRSREDKMLLRLRMKAIDLNALADELERFFRGQ